MTRRTEAAAELQALRAEVASLRTRLSESEETLEAIRNGEIDALVIRGQAGNEVYTLQGAERPYRRLVEAMTEGAAILERTGLILYCNGRLAELVGAPLSSVIGSTLQRFVPQERRGAVDALLRGESGAKAQLEVELTSADGRLVHVLLSTTGSPAGDDAGGVYLVATDLTDQHKRAEIVRASELLSVANDALRESDRRKDEFLAMLAHELRNPLAPITTALHLLVARAGPGPALAAPLGVLQRQTAHLTKLVDQLLEVSRITRGKVRLEKEPLDAATVVARAVELGRPHIDARRQELKVTLPDAPVWVEADPNRLAQALSNLLHNAAKYSEEGGHIRLSVEREGDEALLRVRDDGVGLEPELIPRLFTLFAQADTSLDRSQGGLGIGLALVRGLVELHGGAVEARSDGPGRGSEFTIRLPALAEAPARATPPATHEPARVDCLRVVVVDDNVDAADTLGELLGELGHEVATAHDGEAALARVRTHRAALVFLDIGLPGLDGYEVARRLRAEHGPSLRIAGLSGYASAEHRRRALEAGFDDYLVKPLSYDRLEEYLGGGRASAATAVTGAGCDEGAGRSRPGSEGTAQKSG